MFRILQVDDELSFLELTKTYLEANGEFKLESSSSAMKALNILSSNDFDAIVSDYQMPEMDGIAFLKRVRECDTQIPFILFTGRGREEVAMEALNNGASFYVHKGSDAVAQFGELSSKLRQSIERREFEKAVIESERKLAQAQRIAHLGTWSRFMQNGEAKWSDEMYRIYDVQPTNFKPTYDNFILMVHKEDRAKMKDCMAAASASDDPVSIRFKFVRPNGEIRHAFSQMERVVDRATGQVELQGTTFDITEAVRTEDALKQSEAIWKFALEGSGDGVYDWNIKDGMIYRSERYLDQLGYNNADPLIRYKDWTLGLHPDDRSEAIRSLNDHITGKAPIYQAEYRMRCSDGSYKWILSRGKLVSRDDKGDPLRLVGTHTDFSERRSFEAKLKEQSLEIISQNEKFTQKNSQLIELSERLKKNEMQYKLLVDHVEEGIAMVGPDDRISFSNKALARILDERSENIDGQVLSNFIEPSKRESFGRQMTALRDGKAIKMDQMLVTAIGMRVPVSIESNPLMGPSNDYLGHVLIVLDMTERRAMETALIDTNSKLKILSSITRHDILNQLVVVEGSMSLLKKDMTDQKMLRNIIRMERSLQTITRLINFTKDYESMGVEMPSWQPLRSIWERGVSDIDTTGIKVIADMDGTMIYADPMVEKVFMNLVDNTLRHGGKVDKISLTCIKDNNKMLIVYEDNGIGVSEDEKEKIFQIGYGRHTGLGLFLSRRILGITGIAIIENGTLGQGSRFEIRIPEGKFAMESLGTSKV